MSQGQVLPLMNTSLPYSIVLAVPADLYRMNYGNLIAKIIDLYIELNTAFLRAAAVFMEHFWAPILIGLFLGTFLCLLFEILVPDNKEPLTELEEDIEQYIQMNASTGCTARMIHRHMENAPSMDKINHALDRLKSRGVILPVKTTLWIISGY